MVGDRLYGKPTASQSNELGEAQPDLQLCAVKLAFTCPLSQKNITVELPEVLKPSLAKLTD